MLIERYRRWLEYEIDAHVKTVESIRSVPLERQSGSDFRKALAIFGHMVAARRVWLFRLGIAPAPQGSLFPENPDLDDTASQWRETADLWNSYLGSLTDEDLFKNFEYQSIDGGRFRNQIEDVLTQLFGHSSYHRGQIAMLVRSAGGKPAITDFIYWCREAIA
jgi:uncharacterized damage-inducible protein DinB